MATMMIRRDPLMNEMLRLNTTIEKLFEANNGRTGFAPAMDLSETPEQFVLEFAVSGLKAEDLEMNVENHVLTIKGRVHHASEQLAEGQRYHRIERAYGSFERSLRLPRNVQPDAIRAELTDGILRVELPKSEEAKPRKISIGIGNTTEQNSAQN